MRINFPYISLLFLALLASCAQFGTPQGGPKDVDPPIMVKELSESNYQTNFTKREFELSFNEWIQLNNPAQEIVISPPTDYPLQTNVRGRSVQISFHEEEILKEDITYQINFGDALRDFTESNIYKNLVFVFSTGDEIDSLSVSGSIINATDGKPREDVLVCLYDNLADSALLLQRPFYFTRTDKSGRYKLSNLRADTFQVFCLKDDNVNYIFDLSTEETGFYDTTISLQDSNLINIDLEIFDEIDEPRLISYQQDYKGLIRASLLPETKDIRLEPVNNDSLIHYIEYQKDSLYIWHNDLASDSSLFLLHYDDKTDTLINKRARNKLSDKALTLHSSLKKDLSVHARDTIRVPFNRPLLKIDSIQLSLKDSALYLDVEFLSQDFRELLFTSQSIKHNSEYDLRFFPGSVEDIYGVKNQDTLSLQLKTVDPDQLGTISMNYQNETDTTYLIQFKRGNEILSESVVDSSLSVKFNKLQKGSYTLSLVEDLNGDGKWTGGSVLYKRKPEMIKELNLEELKPGWDLELDIKIKEIFYGTPVE